jgi:hypothetical protein
LANLFSVATFFHRNGTYGSINARPIPIAQHYPDIMANPSVYYLSDDIVSGSRLPGGRMS